MLNDSERRVLEDLEASLCREDPELAIALLDLSPPRGPIGTRVGYDLTILLSLAEASLCLGLHTAGSVPAGLAAAGFAVLTAALRLHRFPRHARRRSRG